MKLKPLNTKSGAECAELVAFVNRHYKSPFPLKREDTRSGKYLFFWAYDGAERVGVSGLMPKTRWLAETVKSVLDPKARGRGLGMALSVAIENEARRLGYKKIMTTIYVDNLPMIFIKLKQGYLFEGFHRDHEKPGLHEYSLGKTLD